MIKVFLHGKLGEKFKKKWSLSISSPREAVRAIDMNTHGLLKRFLIENKDIYYQVIIGKENIFDIKQLDANLSGIEELHFVPVFVGAGGNWGRIIVGGLMVVAGVILIVASKGTMAYPGIMLIMAGVGLIAQGVIGLLSAQPPPLDKNDPKKGGRSFLLDPTINTVSNGDPIPVAYGRLIVPGISIDNYLKTQDA